MKRIQYSPRKRCLRWRFHAPGMLILRIDREKSRRLSMEDLSFLQTSSLTASQHRQYLIGFEACQTKCEPHLGERPVAQKIKRTSVPHQMKDESEEWNVFCVGSVEELFENRSKVATQNHVLLSLIILHQEDWEKSSTKTIIFLLSSTYKFQVYKYVDSDPLRSKNKCVSWPEHFPDCGRLFVETDSLNSGNRALSLNTNATAAFPVHLALLNIANEFRRLRIVYFHTLIGSLYVAPSETSPDFKDTFTTLKKSITFEWVAVPFSGELPTKTNRSASSTKPKIFYEAMQNILELWTSMENICFKF